VTAAPLNGWIYHGARGFEGHLREEIGQWSSRWGELYHGGAAETPAFWNQNIWLSPFRLSFDSISEASQALRGIQRNWCLTNTAHFRRAALIQSRLPPLASASKARVFPWFAPRAPMGSWTLLDPHTIVASARCTSPFPGGAVSFAEDKTGPPSRAYLKLWEALSRCRRCPLNGERCLDAGASPGGWTWALARLGADVTAVDRAPLADRVTAMPRVRWLKHDAFTLKPRDIGALQWLFCDAACYPPRLYTWIEAWRASGLCENFVCTIKMQGKPDMETARRFASIAESAVVHLFYNKHELTWIKVPPQEEAPRRGGAR
jgi:23S rRNA (cytidine2498-2'-O)-methyltransferase